MQQDNTQLDNSQMTPEEAKASLGIATMLQEHLMPQQQPQIPQEQAKNESVEQPVEQEKPNELESFKTEVMDRFDSLEKMFKTDEKSEVEELKKKIEETLNEPD